MMLFIRLLFSAAVVAVCYGCTDPTPRPSVRSAALGIHQRLIESDPQELFSIERISTGGQVFAWDFNRPRAQKGWKLDGGSSDPRVADGALVLQADGARLRLQRRVELDAASVDLIEVAFAERAPQRLRLFWAVDGKGYSKERSVRSSIRDARKDGIFRLRVGASPGWSGKITHLRFELDTAAGQRFELERITGKGFTLDPAEMTTAVGRPWKVDLYGEVRNALLGLPGLPIEREVDIPEASRLRFSYAWPPAVQPVRFRASFETSTGGEAVLFDSASGSGQGAGEGWHDVEVDLASYGGQQGRLRLITETAGDYDPLLGLPAWGNPEILSPGAGPPSPNVLLISIDTLRADHMSLYGYPRSTSPHLDAWARASGVVFETVVAQAPWTLPSHVSLFTGLDALQHGVNHPSPMPPRLIALAEVLRDAGYRTAAFTGGSYLHPKFGLAQGFDSYRATSLSPSQELADTVDRSLAWLQDHAEERPFFLFFHTYEVHDPYDPREPYFSQYGSWDFAPPKEYVLTRPTGMKAREGHQTRRDFRVHNSGGAPEAPLGADDLPLVTALYDSGIAYTDAMLHRLLGALQELELDRETLVVLTSDHGEALGEHGLAGHGSLYDHNLLVPLIIALPAGEGKGRRVPRQVRLVDVLPTVLEVVGVEPPAGIDGVSLVPLLHGKDAPVPQEAFSYSSLTNYGVALRVQDRLKYLYRNTPWGPTSGREELYELDEDPAEQHSVAKESSRLAPLRGRVREALEERLAGLRIGFANPRPQRLCTAFGGQGLRLSTIKTVDPQAACSWGGKHTVECCLAPGEAFTLVAENLESPRLELEVKVGGTPEAWEEECELTLDLGQLAAPQRVDLTGSACRLEPAATGDGALLTFWWQGERDLAAASPVGGDADLRRQLEALGYINN